MNIFVLEMAPMVVQTHVAFAVLAIVLGPIALFRKRRDIWHRITGRLWILAMLCLAGSSFWIHSIRLIGPFSPIHILSIVTLFSLFFGLRAAMRGDALTHGRIMCALYMQALIGAGIFTFLPGRMMNRLFANSLFGPHIVFGLAAAFGAIMIAVIWVHPTLSRSLGSARRIPLFFGGSNR
jgi:uncharacterized membrane protein